MDSGRKTNSCGPTLLDDVVSMIFTKIRYLLDSESTRLTMKTTTLPQAMYDANSTWENSSKWEIFLPPTQNGNEKLTRSQIYVRKELMQQLSLFASILYRGPHDMKTLALSCRCFDPLAMTTDRRTGAEQGRNLSTQLTGRMLWPIASKTVRERG